MSDEENKETELTGIRLALYWVKGIFYSLISLVFLIAGIVKIYHQLSPIPVVLIVIGVLILYINRHYSIKFFASLLVYLLAIFLTCTMLLYSMIKSYPLTLIEHLKIIITGPIIIIGSIMEIIVFSFEAFSAAKYSSYYRVCKTIGIKILSTILIIWSYCATIVCIFVVYSQTQELIKIHWIADILIALLLGIMISGIQIVGLFIGAFLVVKLWDWYWIVSSIFFLGLLIPSLVIYLREKLEKLLRK